MLRGGCLGFVASQITDGWAMFGAVLVALILATDWELWES